MDSLDMGILRILQRDSKTPYHEIAKELKTAASTVHFRVNRLARGGTITGFHAELDPSQFGLTTTAWIGLSVSPKMIKSVANKLSRLPEIQVVGISSGDHDILAQAIAKDEKHLGEFINEKVKTIDGIGKEMHVSYFIEVYKKTINLPI